MKAATYLKRGKPISMHKSIDKGYTLIELLVVIGIIGVLIAISIPAYSQFISPQELRAASQQIKSDLRTLQNNASNGVSSKRLNVDSNDSGAIDDDEDTIPADSRVYWGARFTNGVNSYELAACQIYATSPRLGNETELWGDCKEKKEVKVASSIQISTCTGSCGGYTLFFTPITGAVQVYTSNGPSGVDLVKPDPGIPPSTGNQVVVSPVAITITSTAVPSRSIVLTINKDGSVSESCKNGAATITCN